MTTLVQSAPQFTTDEAARLAAELYGLHAVAEILPSERDQNFRLRDASGAQYVLKIANSTETREVLEFQNQAMEHAGGPGSNGVQTWISAAGATHFVRLLPWIHGVCFAEVKHHDPELLASMGREDRGVLLSTDGPLHNVIKIKPPLVFNRADAGLLLEQLDAVLQGGFSGTVR